MWLRGAKEGQNPLFWSTLILGILKNLEEVKLTLYAETRKNYEVEILPTHEVGKLWLEEVFPEILSLRESVLRKIMSRKKCKNQNYSNSINL